jgi:replicative DNA helicase
MNATENEEAILACLLSHPDQSAPYVCAELRPEHFLGVEGDIYRQILAIYSEGQGIDIMAVAGRLRQREELDKVGGFARLSSLTGKGALPSLLPEHVRAVKEKAAQRALATLLRAKVSEVESPACDVSALLSELMETMEEIGQDRAKRKVPTMRELTLQAMERIQARNSKDVSEVGVSTGIKSLDRETGGLRPGSQWVIAGPAKGGKSSLAISLLKAMAIDAKQRCAFFGLEMPSVENVERLICNVGKVSASGMRDGEIDHQEMGQLVATASKLSTAPIMFRDDIFDLAELLGTARQMKAAFPDLFAIFVDYAQLLSGEDEKNREREVAVISRSLRKLSMQLGLCVVLLSQVNDDGKLRESRALGMDATTVVFIEFDKNPGIRKLRLVQRSGKSGIELKVAYVGEHFQFADLAEGYMDEDEEEKPKHGRNGRKWQD